MSREPDMAELVQICQCKNDFDLFKSKSEELKSKYETDVLLERSCTEQYSQSYYTTLLHCYYITFETGNIEIAKYIFRPEMFKDTDFYITESSDLHSNSKYLTIAIEKEHIACIHFYIKSHLGATAADLLGYTLIQFIILKTLHLFKVNLFQYFYDVYHITEAYPTINYKIIATIYERNTPSYMEFLQYIDRSGYNQNYALYGACTGNHTVLVSNLLTTINRDYLTTRVCYSCLTTRHTESYKEIADSMIKTTSAKIVKIFIDSKLLCDHICGYAFINAVIHNYYDIIDLFIDKKMKLPDPFQFIDPITAEIDYLRTAISTTSNTASILYLLDNKCIPIAFRHIRMAYEKYTIDQDNKVLFLLYEKISMSVHVDIFPAVLYDTDFIFYIVNNHKMKDKETIYNQVFIKFHTTDNNFIDSCLSTHLSDLNVNSRTQEIQMKATVYYEKYMKYQLDMEIIFSDFLPVDLVTLIVKRS
jgi:hypothetical protein